MTSPKQVKLFTLNYYNLTQNPFPLIWKKNFASRKFDTLYWKISWLLYKDGHWSQCLLRDAGHYVIGIWWTPKKIWYSTLRPWNFCTRNEVINPRIRAVDFFGIRKWEHWSPKFDSGGLVRARHVFKSVAGPIHIFYLKFYTKSYKRKHRWIFGPN